MTVSSSYNDGSGAKAEKVSSFSKVLSHELPEGSPIKSIEFKYAIQPNHGAPSSISIEAGDIEQGAFWQKMNAVVGDLNMIPDHLEIRPSELKSGSDWKHRDPKGDIVDFGDGNKQYPNFKGRHSLAGGDRASVDSVSAQDAVPVLSRFIYGLAERNRVHQVQPVMTQEEASSAFQDLFGQIQRVHKELGLDPVSSKRDANGTLVGSSFSAEQGEPQVF